jgi:membrane fusion protein (multidrug efflux system)
MKKLLYIPAILFLAACSKNQKIKRPNWPIWKQQQDRIKRQNYQAAEQNWVLPIPLKQPKLVPEIKTGTFVNYVQIQGKIDAQDNVTAYPQSPGTITALYVKPGQHVSKGQVLGTIR